MEENKEKKKTNNRKTTTKKSTGTRKRTVKEEKVLNEVKDDKLVETVIEKEEVETNSKASFGLIEVIIIMIVTTVFGLFLGSLIAYKKYNNKEEKKVNEESDIKRVYDSLKKEYLGEIEDEELINSSIYGMIESLSDPHAAFIDKKQGLDLNEELSGNFVGLGVEIGDIGDGMITVVNVFDNSPASKADIRMNDKIVKVDGIDMTASDISDIAYSIKTSKKHDKKTITVLRNDETFDVEVELDVVEIQSVFSTYYEYNNKKIGILYIDNFASNTYKQFVKEYKNLKKENIESLIIDLRYNSGGYLSSAHDVVSLFVDKDKVLYQVVDKDNKDLVKNDKEKEIDLPVVIIVNEETASSAEIFAASLRENLETVTIVGTKTYGKGTIQKLFPLSNGAYVKFTTQEWLTPNGNKIEGIGIDPDVVKEVGDDVDTQLETAIEIASESGRKVNS